jgi:hypothetical protein
VWWPLPDAELALLGLGIFGGAYALRGPGQNYRAGEGLMRQDKYLAKAEKLANVILAGQGLFCIIASLYYIYYYSWTHQRYFSGQVGPIVYEVLPLVMACLLFASLLLRPSHKVNFVLILVAIAVSIKGVDLLLAFSDSMSLGERTKAKAKAAQELGVYFDTRSKLEVIADLHKQGISASPVISPSILLTRQVSGILKSAITLSSTEVLPLAGIADKVTVLCNESGEYSIYESDEHGFQNPRGSWKAGHIDIAALGDSFTIGACVPSDKNFVALIRRHWPATLNLGSFGIGPLIELAIFREYAQFMKPKVVLWCYYEENDLEDLRREKDSALLMRYVESDSIQGLLARQTDIDYALTAYVDMAKNASRPPSAHSWLSRVKGVFKLAHLRQHLGLSLGSNYGGTSADQSGISEAELNLFRTVLLRVQASVSAWGGKLYFVYLPQWQRYAGPEITNSHRQQILMLVRNIGFPVIDIHLVFQAQKDPVALFPWRLGGGHYTEVGNQLVAEEILRSITPVAESVQPAGAVSHGKEAPAEPYKFKKNALRKRQPARL